MKNEQRVRFVQTNGSVAWVFPSSVDSIIGSTVEDGVSIIRTGIGPMQDVLRVRMSPDDVQAALAGTRTPAESSPS